MWVKIVVIKYLLQFFCSSEAKKESLSDHKNLSCFDVFSYTYGNYEINYWEQESKV